MLFSDIEGFTSIAESLSPEQLIRLLAEYLEAMSSCVEESGGTVGKYIGDAIMVLGQNDERDGRARATQLHKQSSTCACT